MDAMSAAAAMLNTLDSVQLASVTDDGFPRACEMQLREHEGLRWFQFITKRGSNKVRHFLANPRAGVSFCVGDNCVSLIGTVSITDADPRPGFCVLRFTTLSGTLYVDGVFSKVTYE